MNYLDRLGDLRMSASKKAYKYGDGKAWDNRKMKIYFRHCPRGKAFKKIMAMDHKAQWDSFQKITGMTLDSLIGRNKIRF